MTLVADALIMSPTGWLDLSTGGYELHAEFRANRGITHRKIEVNNEWVEGSYSIRAVRENITESVAVYVRGETHYDLVTKIDALTDAFDQLSYEMRVTYGDSQEVWSCQTADYQVETGKEFSHATMAAVKAMVPRLPTLARTQVAP